MCILYLYYCNQCNKFYPIPILEKPPNCIARLWTPAPKHDYLNIVEAIFCKELSCKRYAYYFYSDNVQKAHTNFKALPGPRFEKTCGMPICTTDTCRIERVRRLCDYCNAASRIRLSTLN